MLAQSAGDNDRLLAALPPGSLVVNATGLGKDAPGSPLSDAAVFPERGRRLGAELPRRPRLPRPGPRPGGRPRPPVEDGWTYFVHGWTQVIAEVFDVAIPTSGPGFDALARIAAEASGRA